MMRYQRVSPDCVPLSSNNGKSTPPSSTTTTTTTNPNITSNNNINNPIASSSSSFEPHNKAFKFRSPSNSNHIESVHQHNHRHESSEIVLPQWGHKKRPRASRTEISRSLTDDSSSSSSAQAKQQQQQQGLKPQRRVVGPTTTASMPPPPIPSPSNGRARKEANGLIHNRNLEDRSGLATGSSPSRSNNGSSARFASRSTTGKRSPPPEKSDKKISSLTRTLNEKLNGSSTAQTDRINHVDPALLHRHDQEAGNINYNGSGLLKEEKTNTETLEWPKVQIPLSRKEKEEDFLVMKGSKLPQRPKKRPKNVERALQYVFPGTWLVDVTRNRYEVREKKCVKKQKRRGLKGMESVESDSE